MQIPRRSLLKGAVGTAFSSAFPSMSLAGGGVTLPVKGEFVVDQYEVCLNNARWHPMSKGAQRAVIEYTEYKARGVWDPQPGLNSVESVVVRRSFAELIGAVPEEIAFVNSTTAGENMVVAALGLREPGKYNIVTDALHFEGSLYLYQELAKRGVEVRIVKPRGWEIVMGDLEKVVDKSTRLVALSKIS